MRTEQVEKLTSETIKVLKQRLAVYEEKNNASNSDDKVQQPQLLAAQHASSSFAGRQQQAYLQQSGLASTQSYSGPMYAAQPELSGLSAPQPNFDGYQQ